MCEFHSIDKSSDNNVSWRLYQPVCLSALLFSYRKGKIICSFDFRTFPILDEDNQYHTMPSIDMVVTQPINTIVSYSEERKEEDMFKFGDPLNFYPIPKDRRLD